MKSEKAIVSPGSELQFERLINEFYTLLLTVPIKELNEVLLDGLRKISDYFNADNVFLFEYDDRKGIMETILYANAEHAKNLTLRFDYDQLLPYISTAFRRNKIINMSSRKKLPPEAERDVMELNQTGIRSFFAVPLNITGEKYYGMTAVSEKAQCWSDHKLMPIKVLGEIMVNVMERIRVRQLLEETERKYRIISDFSHDIEVWRDHESKLVYISPSCKRITGYTPEEFLQDQALLASLIFEEDRKMWEAHVNRSDPSKGEDLLQFRLRSKDGRINWIERTEQPITDEQGQYLGIRISYREINERKKIEEDLLQSEARYRGVVEDQTELICRTNPEGILTFVNQSYCRYFGLNAEEFINRSFMPLIPEEDRDIVNDSFNALSPGQPTVTAQHRVILKDGSIRWLAWVYRGYFDEAGLLNEVQSVGRDITGSKLAEIKLRQAYEEIDQLKQKLQAENVYLKDLVDPKTAHCVVVNSEAMQRVMTQVQQVAPTDSTVLIMGETGTGKELIAQTIHQWSKRSDKVMITVNCAALPSSLIESELFGREKGAYTGALTRQIGRFEMAHRSTIFLDEIGEIPLELQVKLLRMIQFGEFERLGSPVTHTVDVRIIAATNRNLQKALEEGAFRKDLYYRLGVFPIYIPPLRERTEDIPALIWSLMNELTEKTGKRIDTIPRKVIERLSRHSWPGNVRELRNVIEHAIILTNSHTLNIEHMETASKEDDSRATLEDVERMHILHVLKKANWRIRGKDGAAEILGLNEATLRFRMKKLGIHRPV
jgi:PAS domain S-box-containing protein